MKIFYIQTKHLLFFVATLFGFSVFGQGTLTITMGDITLDPKSDTIVTAEVADSLGNPVSNARIMWSTDPGYIGKVEKNGKLVANHPGEGYLIAKYRNLRDSVKLIVTGTPKPHDDDDHEGMMENEYPKVKIVPDNIRIEISDSVEMRAFYIDSAGIKVDTTFTWSVEPDSIGFFSGTVSGLFFSAGEPGTGMVIASRGDLADTAKITVYETREKREKIQKEKDRINNRGKQLDIEPDDMIVYVGHEPIQYAATYKTNGIKHQEADFIWSVTDTSIAKIEADGLLTLTGETGMTLVCAKYSNFKASVELLVVDSTIDLDVNTISIRRVMPDGKELRPKYFREGDTYRIGGLPYPLNLLNAGMLHFPFGCVSEDIDIFMFIPEAYAKLNDDSTEVDFSDKIITGVKFSVIPAGSDTIVEPYYFNIPVELKLIYKQELLDSLGINPMDLDMFFADNAGFIPVDGGDQIAMVDTARNRIYASIEHFSTIVVKEGHSKTEADDLSITQSSELHIYPNPFNISTRIEFTLEEGANVQLSIFNLNGQQVKVLVEGALPEGQHQFVWRGQNENGTRATAGVYICRFLKDGVVSNVQQLIINR